MSKLISVGLIRLRKSYAFPVCLLFLFVYGAFSIVDAMNAVRAYGYEYAFENYFFDYAPMMAFVMAVFVGMFLGTEYSDGTLRNKLIVGHGRRNIYLSNFIVCSAGGILMCLIYMPVMLLAGIWFVWWHFPDHMGRILLMLLVSLFMVVAYAAVYTLIAMIISSKANAIIVGVVIAAVMLMAANHVDTRLSAADTLGMQMVLDEDGSLELREGGPNPDYISDNNIRTLYELAYDLNPMGQAIQLSNQSTERMYRWPFLAMGIAAAVTGAGIFLFGKKDIK